MKWLLPLSIVIVWIVATAAGMYFLMVFDSTPGVSANTPDSWPAGSKVSFQPGRTHLIMLAHPQCPCTRASLGELAEIMVRGNGKLAAAVLFYKPSQIPQDWDDDGLAKVARGIPSVKVIDDIDGVEAARFGAATSGHTLLYDGGGNLRFSGGITKARGQAGDNAGRQTVLSAVDEAIQATEETPVYGCPIFARPTAGGANGKDTLCVE
jgi:hypothetical protein